MFDEIKKIKSGKKELREFGYLVGGILLCLGAISLMRGRLAGPYLAGAGTLLVIAALFAYNLLLPFHKIWMAVAVILGYFVSRVILYVLFYMVVTPIGLLARLFNKDLLDIKIDRKRVTYWKKREVKQDMKSYENQF